MTFRERLADWISGGALSETRSEAKEISLCFLDAVARLDDIVHCETPSANATVKRMARIARGEE